MNEIYVVSRAGLAHSVKLQFARLLTFARIVPERKRLLAGRHPSLVSSIAATN
jgi:hypothetical protein